MVYDLQKASLWKRFSAFLFDAILTSILAVLFMLALSWATGYDGYNQQLHAAYERISEAYGVQVDPSFLSTAEYEALPEAERAALDQAYAALRQDAGAMRANQMIMTLTQVIVSLGLLLACLTMEFLIPLRLKDGRTLGKRIFGLAVMGADGVRVTPVQLLIRTLLGKYTFEIMVPLFIALMFLLAHNLVALIVLFLLAILEIVVLCVSQTNALIHDLLANTAVVDYMSQMIFDTREDLIAYKQKVAAEIAQRQPY